jgi:hypothetical protein
MQGTNQLVLSHPNNREDAATVRALLAGVSSRFAARLAPDVVRVGPAASGGPGDGWVGVDALLSDPRSFPRLVAAACPRFGSDDRTLVGAQLVREWVSTVTTAAVAAWGRDRRAFDWSAGNVAVRADGSVGLRGLGLAVLGGDELAGGPATGGSPGVAGPSPALVTVTTEARLVERVLDGAIGHPVRAGARPGGPVAGMPAVAAVVAAARRATRSGARLYWGTVGLAVVNGLTAVSHDVGPRADRDRELLLRRRPDLARTVELVTTDDGAGGTVSCGRRLTCCLLVKLPGEVQCGTCNLRDRDECVTSLAVWARGQRADRRAPASARAG